MCESLSPVKLFYMFLIFLGFCLGPSSKISNPSTKIGTLHSVAIRCGQPCRSGAIDHFYCETVHIPLQCLLIHSCFKHVLLRRNDYRNSKNGLFYELFILDAVIMAPQTYKRTILITGATDGIGKNFLG